MVTIQQSPYSYRMKFSAPGTGWRSYSVNARDLTQIKLALDHHYGNNGFHNNQVVDGCPLCEHSAKETKRMKGKLYAQT